MIQFSSKKHTGPMIYTLIQNEWDCDIIFNDGTDNYNSSSQISFFTDVSLEINYFLI